jgi:hypothetical protein
MLDNVDWVQVGAIASAILVGAMHTYSQYKATGKISLDKSLDLAPDVIHKVISTMKERVDENGDEKLGLEEGIKAGVDAVAALRGKRKLARAHVRKLGARFRSLLPED